MNKKIFKDGIFLGKINISGDLDSPKITGNLALNNVSYQNMDNLKGELIFNSNDC